MGPCAGGAVYSPAITDFVFMVKNTSLHVRDRARRHPDRDARGRHRRGARRRRRTHGATSGVAHFAADGEEDASALIRELLTFLPSNNLEDPPLRPTARPGRSPGRSPTDAGAGAAEQAVRHEGPCCAACSTTTTSSRCTRPSRPTSWSASAALGGRPVGIVANQPAHLAGCLDINASVKGARFVRFCDCFNIPLVTFEDVPGFLPGHRTRSTAASSSHGAKLLYAYCEATVPKLTVITRKAYGGAYDVMSLQAHPRRRELRLAHRRDRRDGARGRGQRALPARDGGGSPTRPHVPGRPRPASTGRSSPIPTSRPSGATWTR